MLRSFFLLLSVLILPVHFLKGQGGSSYFPKGDPAQWNIALTPFLWLPWSEGDIGLGELEAEFTSKPIDLLRNLRGTALMKVEVSRSKFVTSASYTYLNLGTEKVLRVNSQGENALIAIPDMKMHLLNYDAGGRITISENCMLDIHAGFRYINIHPSVSVEGPLNTNEFETRIDFWDPVAGFRFHYFPKPRVPVIMYADLGGFTAGARYSWSLGIYSGYSVSPLIDITAGMHGYGFEYKEVSESGRTTTLSTMLYGFDMGISFLIPKRYKDPTLFKSRSGK